MRAYTVQTSKQAIGL